MSAEPSKGTVRAADTAAEAAETPSQSARQKGNALHGKGAASTAIALFQEAADCDPTDPSLLSNISAAHYEAGQYGEAVRFVEQALELLADDDEAEPQRQKLYGRAFRSLMCSWSLEEAEMYANKVADEKQRASHLTELDSIRPFALSPEKKKATQVKVIGVPRYKTRLQLECEYFPVGHDSPETEAFKELLMTAGQHVAWMFCGIGDARNMYRTLIGIAQYEVVEKTASQQYHMTILDIKATTLARNLIVFTLLEDLSKDWQNEEAMAAVSYAFLEPIIPKFAWDRLQGAIAHLKTALRESRQPLDWVFVPPQYQEAILQYLDQWTGDLGKDYTTEQFQKLRGQSTKNRQRSGRQMFGIDDDFDSSSVPKGCKREVQIFRALQTLLPPNSLLKAHDPELATLSEGLKSRHKSAKDLNPYIIRAWKPNPTFIDFAWQKYRETDVHRDGSPPEMSYNSFEVATTLHSSIEDLPSPNGFKKKECTLDYIGQFWVYTALAINKLRNRLLIEVMVEEMSVAMELIKMDALEYRHETEPGTAEKQKQAATATASKFPRLFHRIHMSNVPDYVGNHMTTFLCAAPLLNPHPGPGHATGMLAANLFNPASYENQAMYLTEHILMHHDELVRSHFGVRLDGDSESTLATFENMNDSVRSMSPMQRAMMAQIAVEKGMSPQLAMMGMGMGMPNGFGAGGTPFLAISDYWTWELSPPYEDAEPALLTRNGLTHWLHAHLLKLVLPYPRPPPGPTTVLAPLNVSVFFRLVVHLAERRIYPGHWLGAVLAGVAAAADADGSGRFTTTARAPTRDVHDGASAAAVPQAKDLAASAAAAEEKRAKAKKTKLAKAGNRSKAAAPAWSEASKPPPKEPAKAKVHPKRAISLRPFAAEFSTLLAMWRPTLPFAFAGCDAPRPGSVRRYAVRFPAGSWARPYLPGGARGTKFIAANAFVLVFWDAAALGAEGPFNLRCLVDDETADAAAAEEDTSGKVQAMREYARLSGQPILSMDPDEVRRLRANDYRGVHVVTCVTWDSWEKEEEGMKGLWEARFWMRDDTVEDMMAAGDGKESKWLAFMYRTDTADMIVRGVEVKKALTKVESWAD